MKRTRSIVLAAILLLSMMVMFVTPAVAATLWVVPENPTRWSDSTASDQLLQETVVSDVVMGLTVSGNVLVLNQAAPQDATAEDVYLKFFVNDASNIRDIIIGTAKRIEPGTSTTTDPNPDSDSSAQTLTFSYVSGDPPVPAGAGVSYLIGDIPFSGGPAKTGDPEPDVNNFNPDNANCYIKVPFTINFKHPPRAGFTLYAYVDNGLDGKDRAKTAWSHDCGYNHIPEFATIAIPAIALLGLFAFYRRKQKK